VATVPIGVEHTFLVSPEDGHGSISAVVFLRDKGALWLYHYIAYAWKDKSQYTTSPIEVTKDPGDLKEYGEKLLREFAATIDRIGGEEHMLRHLVDFSPKAVLGLMNKVYDSMWDMNIRPAPSPPKKVEAQFRKICNRYMLQLVDVWYKSELSPRERLARIPKHLQPRY
jgi:hypothetical protein